MTRNVAQSTTRIQEPAAPQTDGFDLNVGLLEVSDAAGLTNLTDDNCGTTCGACTTNVA
ncbi:MULTISPECIES: FxLD family lanthipeptide [unclassified Streptomyces]|uniref:FxLD family lanthipeptide n=1 Tax=unclassified Streptomyces TaxID=2593676 RepID=UPI0035D989B6